ncbi:putative NTF2-related export protein 1/2 [Paratrimastix pyriformis]|uniref:NTF2-related export protein n=1 Tax=Paratrimastix pyriformis TaxID=342808 RepID=A0ABQ8UUI2_9EUKA|nr:putative NTF2-related export protein 1/2 [Paratrimastix pyriformis]
MSITQGIVENSARTAIAFITEWFYRTYDTERHKLCRFYRPESQVFFNGNRYAGEAIDAFFKDLPRSQHTVLTIDCQPVMAAPPQGDLPSAIMVVATGQVSYGNDAQKPFTENFLMVQDPQGQAGQFYIISDNFRMVNN